MLRVRAFDALAGTKTQIDGTPRRQKRGERAHVSGRSAAPAEACGESRKTTGVGRAGRARGFHLVGNQIERFVPGDTNETWVLVAALLWVGPLHRIEHAVRAVRFLHQPERLDAGLAAAGMDGGSFKIRVDLGGDPVLDADGQQVRPRYALVAIGRNDAFLRRLASRHSLILSPSGGTCLVRDPLRLNRCASLTF